MLNGLEYILKLNDQFSTAFTKAAGVADNAAIRIQRDMDKVTGSTTKFKYSLNDLKAKLDSINATRMSTNVESVFNRATREARKLELQIDKLENKGRDNSGALGAIGRRIAVAASFTAAMAFGSSSVNAAMNFGATTKGFEVLTGSAQKGRDLANTLNKLQQDTILGPEVFKSAQTMMSFGVATENVVKVQKQLGDVSMGNKDRFEALTLAYSQTTSAGKLMGQDLLQYVNAGFNPLQTISEKWEQFGFKQKQSVGQLRDMMEKGLITSGMVAKAFDIATSAGGKFGNMMDAMAQTSYGKMQILQGSFESFKINVGNALMPVAEGLMDVGARMLDVLNISKTAPQILQQEQAELKSLLGVITSLNVGNDLRTRLLQQLNVKYPDLFKNINIETATNGDLLKMLNDINAAYDKLIGFATNDFIIGNATKELQNAQSEFTKYATLVELMQRGDVKGAHKLRSFKDAFNVGPFGNELNYYKEQAANFKKILDEQSGIIKNETGIKASKTFAATIDDAYKLFRAPLAERESIFGKDAAREKEFDKLAGRIQLQGGRYKTFGGGLAFADQLRNLMNPVTANANGGTNAPGTTALGNTSKSTADAVNSGGQRSIVINIDKQVGAENINVLNGAEAANNIESLVREAMRRMLLSLNGKATANA